MMGYRDDPESSESSAPFGLGEEWGGGAGGTGSGGPSTRIPTSDSSAAATPAVKEASKRTVRGVVRDIQVRTDSQTQVEKLTFRIERYTASGNRLPPVPVEMNRYRGGSLTDGDEVEVGGRWSHGTLRAKRIRNLTTLAQLRGPDREWRKWVVAVLVLLALGVGGFAAFTVIRNQASHNDLKIPAMNQSPLPGSSEPANQPPANQPPAKQAPAPQQPAPQQPATQQPEPQKQVTVADVAGRPLSDAAAALESSGLRIAITREPNDSVPADTVTGTNPPSGSSLPYGSLVKISVSSGPGSSATDPTVPTDSTDPTDAADPATSAT